LADQDPTEHIDSLSIALQHLVELLMLDLLDESFPEEIYLPSLTTLVENPSSTFIFG